MSNLGLKIREIREAKGWSQSMLARATNISNDYMSRIELGKVSNVGIEVVEAIAKNLTVPITFLLNDQETEHKKNWSPEIIDQFVEVPLLSGSVSAGDFQQSFKDWKGEVITIPKLTHKSKDFSKELIAWRVRGRSMEPKYLDGDCIVISRTFDSRDGLDVITVRDANEITVKQIKMFKDGSIELRPYNPDYPSIHVQSLNDLQILGVVVALFRDMIKKIK